MSKVRFLNWDDLFAKVKIKSSAKEIHLQSTATILSRLLVVARSDRDLDLQTVISKYEFSNINPMLLNSDGSILKCKSKSDLIDGLESLVPHHGHVDVDRQIAVNHQYLIIDAMAVVQSLMHVGQFKMCKDLGEAFVKYTEHLLQDYSGGRLIFDNYQKILSIKDSIRYSTTTEEHLHIDDSTPIIDTKKILSSKTTKHSLTIYLAEKAILKCKHPIITVTSESVLTNEVDMQPLTPVSTQEEADTLMILHGLEAAMKSPGCVLHFFTQDTDWWVLLLRRLDELGPNVCILTGTSDRRRLVPLQPIYEVIGRHRTAALPGFHALTGSDTTGQINGVGKKTGLKVFMKCSSDIIQELANLGKDEVLSDEVVKGCEQFLCKLLSSKTVSASDASSLRWKKFKTLSQTKWIDKLPPTSGAMLQHIKRAHLQARLWAQDNVIDPVIPDPCSFGWRKEGGKLIPVLSENPIVPSAVIELTKCNCGVSKCSARCSCKQHNLECTELCKCEANENCANVLDHSISDDSGAVDEE